MPRPLVAQEPLRHRADARLMVVDRRQQQIEHHHVRDLPHLLPAGDRLVLNDTKVIPAQLAGRRARTDGRWQGLFLEAAPDAAGSPEFSAARLIELYELEGERIFSPAWHRWPIIGFLYDLFFVRYSARRVERVRRASGLVRPVPDLYVGKVSAFHHRPEQVFR